MTVIDVRLRPKWVERVGYRYDVLLDGEIIVRRSRDPEYDTARVLHARGLRGRFRTVDFNTGKPRMILDIEKAAKLTTVERDERGPPTVGRYRPMSEATKSRLQRQRSDHGGDFSDEAVLDTGQPAAAAGGQTVVGSSRSGDTVPSARVREDA